MLIRRTLKNLGIEREEKHREAEDIAPTSLCKRK